MARGKHPHGEGTQRLAGTAPYLITTSPLSRIKGLPRRPHHLAVRRNQGDSRQLALTDPPFSLTHGGADEVIE